MSKIVDTVKAMDEVRAELATLKSQHRALNEADKQDGKKSDQKDLDMARAALREKLAQLRSQLVKEFNEEANRLSTKMPAEVFEERVRELAAVASKENISMAHIRHLTRARLGLPGKSKQERSRARRNKALKEKEVK